MRPVKNIDQCFDAEHIDIIRTWLVEPYRRSITLTAKHNHLGINMAYHRRWKWQVTVFDPSPTPRLPYGGNHYYHRPRYDGFTTKRKALVAAMEKVDEAHRQIEAATIEIF